MATYYVDFANGNDANNGLGPDASHASNKPWKTLTKALGASGISSGDTVYLAPGSFRETVSVAMTSATAETKVIGDVDNAQGFKTSGGVRVAPGPVILTAYTTNDKTAPSGTTLLALSTRDYLTFERLMFVGGTTDIVTSTSGGAANIKFTDCAFLVLSSQATAAISFGSIPLGNVLNWTIDRCIFFGGRSSLITLSMANSASGADSDIAFTIKNSVSVTTGGAVFILQAGAPSNTFKQYGIRVFNHTAIGGGVLQTNGNHSTSNASTVFNSLLLSGQGTALNANASGQIIEDYNIISANTPRSNVSAGAHSVSDGSYAHLLHFGQERIWNALLRPFGQPMAGSPLLGFGNDGNQTSYDARNRPRPAGGASALPAVGAMERGNTFDADPSPIGSGGSAIKATGPAYAEFLVPVPARAITISCKVKWDATYAGTKPQLQIDANARIGVATETKTATGSSGNVETLTLTPFTPTRDGDMVTIRVLSNDTNGAGVLQVDDFTVTG